MADNSTNVTVNGHRHRTLKDILPRSPGLKILFVAKTPATKSVKAGHYFQGKHGRMFWNRLKEYGILNPTTEFEDDSLLDHKYGVTDIVKIPRDFGNEPSADEYKAGVDRILRLIKKHTPKVVVVVYKKVLDEILRIRFGVRTKSVYGLNPDLQQLLGTRVFVFPMPGTPCKRQVAVESMNELREIVLDDAQPSDATDRPSADR